MAIEGKGRWVTIAGQHIFLEEGESPMAGYIRHMASKGKKKLNTSKAKTSNSSSDGERYEIKENKFRINDPYILYGEKKGTGSIPSKERLINYFNKRAAKEDDEDLGRNAEKYAEGYIKYREELEKKRRK